MTGTKDVLIGAIRACKNRSQLEDIFGKFEVNDDESRFDILMNSMYDPEFFFSTDSPDAKLRYELAIEMFLTMNWKMSALYEKSELV